MTRHAFVLAAVSCVLSCRAEAPPAPGAASAPAASPAPVEALDRMDSRTPVPLLPMMAHHQKQNMRDHLAAVQEIVSALAADDLAGVERAAGRIGSSPQMEQMCTHMGAGAPGFTEQGLAFHQAADAIGAAARAGDRGRVLSALGATLETCISCHSRWKQKVVDEAAWQEATSSPLPPMHAPGH